MRREKKEAKKAHAVRYALLTCLLFAVPTSTHGVSLHLVYLSTAVCISEEANLGPCWHMNIPRVKGQAKITKVTFLSQHNQYALIEWPLFNAPTSTYGVFLTLFSLYKCCYLHFRRNTFGSVLAQGYLKDQRTNFNYKRNLH